MQRHVRTCVECEPLNTYDRDFVRRAAEGCDIALSPIESHPLVQETKIVTGNRQLGRRWKPEDYKR